MKISDAVIQCVNENDGLTFSQLVAQVKATNYPEFARVGSAKIKDALLGALEDGTVRSEVDESISLKRYYAPRNLNPATVKPTRKLYMWSSEEIMATCPACSKWAVVPLPPDLVKAQPDDTTHVCHPGFGGCNQGYALTKAGV